MQFEIQPYKGAAPLYFGMYANDVIQVMGNPEIVDESPVGEYIYYYRDVNICFSRDDRQVVEIGFTRLAQVYIDRLNIFSDPKAFQILLEKDGHPFELLGFIILLELGITLTGFHDDDESQLAVTVFASGRWNNLIAKLKPYHSAWSQ